MANNTESDWRDQLSLANQELGDAPDDFNTINRESLDYIKKMITWAQNIRLPLRHVWEEARDREDYIMMDKIQDAFQPSFEIRFFLDRITVEINQAEANLVINDLNWDDYPILSELVVSVMNASQLINEILYDLGRATLRVFYFRN
ncbi:MAG TPA: hypothetical protein PKI61_02130 [bacterium]|nr:hypothetical protein [bacterium]HPT29950.1 hypothetical protein [bacterium]